MEMIKPERPDSTVSLKGLDYVDVPSLNKMDYKISFFSYKECHCNAKVEPHTTTFCPNSTKLLQLYSINKSSQLISVMFSTLLHTLTPLHLHFNSTADL